jgi:hypothetical protein
VAETARRCGHSRGRTSAWVPDDRAAEDRNRGPTPIIGRRDLMTAAARSQDR